jgi:hypothetical protein
LGGESEGRTDKPDGNTDAKKSELLELNLLGVVPRELLGFSLQRSVKAIIQG